MPNTSSMRPMRSPVNPPPRSVWNTSMPPNGKRSVANAAGTRSASCRVPTAWPVISRFASSPGRHMHAHELPTPHVGRVGGQVGARLAPVEPAGRQVGCRAIVRFCRMRPVPGPRIRARHAPGLHDPVDAAARHDDALMFQDGLDLPGPVHSAAVAPHASHILLMGVGPFGLGVSEHPAVGRLGNAQGPALRRYRAAAGVGPYHACFRANTGAATRSGPAPRPRIRCSTGRSRPSDRSRSATRRHASPT